MNYITQLNGFYDSMVADPLSTKAQCLYGWLLHLDNRLGWKEWFTVPNQTLQALAGLSRVDLDRSRNELKQRGFIEYEKGSGRNAGKYLIVCFDIQTVTQSATQTDTQTAIQTDAQLVTQCDTQTGGIYINKQKSKYVSNNNKTTSARACARTREGKQETACRESYEELMKSCGVPPMVQQAMWRFIRHCAMNGKKFTNDVLTDLIVALDTEYGDDPVAQCTALDTAMRQGYVDIYRGG